VEEVLARLKGAGGEMEFLDFFAEETSRVRIVGIFLAMLELLRKGLVRARERAGGDEHRIEIALGHRS